MEHASWNFEATHRVFYLNFGEFRKLKYQEICVISIQYISMSCRQLVDISKSKYKNKKYHDTNNPTFVLSGPSIADSAQLLLLPDQDKDQHEDGWVLHVLL